jgi:hypothetical protein
MARGLGAVQGTHGQQTVLNWTEILAKAGLESPGYQEAADATAAAWELKQQQRQCLKPRGRGKRGRGSFPSLKHGAD